MNFCNGKIQKKEMSNMDAVLYIHGKGGSAEEAEHYRALFPSCEVLGLDYQTFTPWETGREIHEATVELKKKYDKVILIANSVGAFFSMNAESEGYIDHAYFISPIVDMEKLIVNMMAWAGIDEKTLKERGNIPTSFGEDLSWEYLCYVRNHPIRWHVPTDILMGSEDHLTDIATVKSFCKTRGASLTVMEGGEHWFHTPEQMRFLDVWIKEKSGQ